MKAAGSKMAYIPYATKADYGIYGTKVIPEENIERALRLASRHIDSLTYNRIIGQGFSCLTDFQQEVIKEVVCRQAEFEFENADEIASVLSSYSINGVSAEFGDSWNLYTDMGVAMQRDNYELLKQTGLCCRLLR